MQPCDPLPHVENAAAVLVDGRWPNFHDAGIDERVFCTGDIRPEEDVWTGAALEVERSPNEDARLAIGCTTNRARGPDAFPTGARLSIPDRP